MRISVHLSLTLFLLAVVAGPARAADWDRVTSKRFTDHSIPSHSGFPSWFKQSFYDLREDLAEARSAGKLGILLFLSEANCSYCQIFLSTTFREPDIRKRVGQHFDVLGFEVVNDIALTDLQGQTLPMKQFVAREKAYVTPTLIFLRHDGRRLLQIAGYYPPERFRGVLDYLLDGHDERETLALFLARREVASRGSADPIRRDAELFAAPPYALDRRAAPAQRPLLVLLERPGCEACAQFHRNVLVDPAIRALVKKFESIQLDISDDHTPVLTPAGERLSARKWAEQLAVADAPSLLFFDEKGREVFRLESELLRNRTEGSMQLVLEKGYLDEPQLQRWRRSKTIGAQEQQR